MIHLNPCDSLYEMAEFEREQEREQIYFEKYGKYPYENAGRMVNDPDDPDYKKLKEMEARFDAEREEELREIKEAVEKERRQLRQWKKDNPQALIDKRDSWAFSYEEYFNLVPVVEV